MRKDNLIMSLWMLLVLLTMLSTCCEELKEDYKPKQMVNWDTVKETETEEKEEMELQAYYKMDANGNLVRVYKKEP